MSSVTSIHSIMENTISKVTSHASLAGKLRGQTMHLPNILEMFSTWPQGNQNIHYENLQLVIDQIFERVISDEKRREKFKKSDFALFCSFWYPDAKWERIYLCGIFTAWAFLWDDTIDTNEHALSDDFEQACLFRQQSLDYVKYWLEVQDTPVKQEAITSPGGGLLDGALGYARWLSGTLSAYCGSGTGRREPMPPSKGCGVFKEFGQKASVIFDKVQRARFYEQVEFFSKCTEIEQAERLANEMPTREHYMEVRLGTTADHIYCCLEELAVETALSSRIMDSATMRECWKECNVCIIIINDILSLKKEIATDCVINLIPVVLAGGQSLQEVVDGLLKDLQKSRDRFDDLARKLEASVVTEKPLSHALRKYLNGLRRSVTGTIEYSLHSKRYGITKYLKEDGTLDLLL